MKSTFQITIAALAFFCTAISVSCKKSNEALADNNPNINDRLIDSVSVAPASPHSSRTMAIDLDGDALTDFYMVAAQDSPNVYRTSFIGVQRYVNFLTDGQGYVSPTGAGALIDSVSAPNPPKPHIWADVALSSIVGPGLNLGEANGTDFFLGAFTTKNDGKHYGWLKLNISADGKSIRLKELACYSKAMTAIKAGEK
ncbi:MAG: hypothetical protein JWN78_2793 [Bacteroidota bacterium]|nr:hypothetical protein [Bacteroidota bacterium]